jgi:hypothetical protein
MRKEGPWQQRCSRCAPGRAGAVELWLPALLPVGRRVGACHHRALGAVVPGTYHPALGLRAHGLAHPRTALRLCARRDRGLPAHRRAQLDRTPARGGLASHRLVLAVGAGPRGRCILNLPACMAHRRGECGVSGGPRHHGDPRDHRGQELPQLADCRARHVCWPPHRQVFMRKPHSAGRRCCHRASALPPPSC